MKEKRQGYDPVYVAVRVVSPEGRTHYHELLLLNDSETERVYRHIKNANDALNSTLGYPAETRSGLINDCTKDRHGAKQPNGALIGRNPYRKNKTENDSFRHASYLAKNANRQVSYFAKKDSYDITPSLARKFFTSQFEKDYDTAAAKRQYWAEKRKQKED